MGKLIAALDQGTSSTRLALFDGDGALVVSAQREHRQIHPGAGLVEHDALEIWERAQQVIADALAQTDARDVAALGITNQRETVVVWERESGRPVHNAIVWQDTRTAELMRELAGDAGPDRLRATTGLPLSTYFSGPKIAWILDAVPGARQRAAAGELACGTVDSWLLWQLTAGAVHATDVTNASRTLLMDLSTLDWDEEALALIGVPAAILPRIAPSAALHGEVARGPLAGCPVAALVGDQQASLFGQACFAAGDAKCTYGTGAFLLVNTGRDRVASAGLLTTVAARVGDEPATYALEGSIAVAGSAVQWLRDKLGIIASAGDVEALAASVADNGGVYFVPAFSGLFAPRWREDARGTIVGLTAFAGAGHLARATLEASCWQTREVVDEATAKAGVALPELRVDGGMTADSLLMQLLADALGLPVVRSEVRETTALGTAFAAGLAVDAWPGRDALGGLLRSDGRFEPELEADLREQRYATWRAAVERSLDWPPRRA
ncbi:MAG TPA: glycerol kinase GlpK [Solirubrobacteraceae bacterium]|nr:glycerol kinase GlpK [Solirubrobacteraceae bacterium]